MYINARHAHTHIRTHTGRRSGSGIWILSITHRRLVFRWFVAVMPSSEEESLWLVGSGGGLTSPGSGGGILGRPGERTLGIRGVLYTQEMQASQPAITAEAGAIASATSADSAEHDLIDSTSDATLLAQFHEDAIKQVSLRFIHQLHLVTQYMCPSFWKSSKIDEYLNQISWSLTLRWILLYCRNLMRFSQSCRNWTRRLSRMLL